MSEHLSLEEQLKNRLKKGLNPTSTKVTQQDGTITILENQVSVLSTTQKIPNKISFGFVVDTKPDLSVGEVLPWLFISSQDVPNDVNILSKLKITHLLSLLPGFEITPIVKPLIKSHLVLNVFDEMSFNLSSPPIQEALRYMLDCKSSGNKILVHCNAGISRAPSVAILYLMSHEGLSFQESYQQVKVARPHARPNDGFLQQLQKFHANIE